MFMTNNHVLFHLWSKKKLVRYKKFSKYCVHHYLENSISVILSLLAASVVKISAFFARIYLNFMKKTCWTKILTSVKRLEKSL